MVISIPVRLMSQGCAQESNVVRFDFNGHSYEVVKEMKSWADAVDCAEERGGILAEIADSAEQDAIYSAIVGVAAVALDYTSVANGGGSAYVWIGATDIDAEGQWVWDGNHDGVSTLFWTGEGANGAGDGVAEPGAWANWGGMKSGTANEPDDFGNNQDGGAICLTGWPSGTTMLGDTSEWNDIQATSLCYFVIEYDHILGLNEEEGSKPQVFPNPAVNQVQISIPGNSSRRVVVYNETGQLIVDRMIAGNSTTVVSLQEFYGGAFVISIPELNWSTKLLKR